MLFELVHSPISSIKETMMYKRKNISVITSAPLLILEIDKTMARECSRHNTIVNTCLSKKEEPLEYQKQGHTRENINNEETKVAYYDTYKDNLFLKPI